MYVYKTNKVYSITGHMPGLFDKAFNVWKNRISKETAPICVKFYLRSEVTAIFEHVADNIYRIICEYSVGNKLRHRQIGFELLKFSERHNSFVPAQVTLCNLT